MPIIEIKAVSKIFPPANAAEKPYQALNNIHLSVEPGEILGIVGMSGAGKSTLMRCLIGLEKPSKGQILFHEQDINADKTSSLSHYRKKIGMVFQNFHLFPAKTLAENIAYPMEIQGVRPADCQRRVDELLKLVHLEHKRNAYPSSLSGGQKQKIAIARALANQPEVLFCDEPTSALDPKSIESLLGLLKELNKKLGLTIILITHQWEVVKEICTHVAVLCQGCLVEKGAIGQFIGPSHDLSHPVNDRHHSNALSPETVDLEGVV